MLVAGIVVGIFGWGYILRQAVVAELTADWAHSASRWLVRRLRAHAASRRAADLAYQTKWDEHERFWAIEEQM